MKAAEEKFDIAVMKGKRPKDRNWPIDKIDIEILAISVLRMFAVKKEAAQTKIVKEFFKNYKIEGDWKKIQKSEWLALFERLFNEVIEPDLLYIN